VFHTICAQIMRLEERVQNYIYFIGKTVNKTILGVGSFGPVSTINLECLSNHIIVTKQLLSNTLTTTQGLWVELYMSMHTFTNVFVHESDHTTLSFFLNY